MLQMYLIDIAIPHQSQIGSEEQICDSFTPGEAFGTSRNCKINYHLPTGLTPQHPYCHICSCFRNSFTSFSTRSQMGGSSHLS